MMAAALAHDGADAAVVAALLSAIVGDPLYTSYRLVCKAGLREAACMALQSALPHAFQSSLHRFHVDGDGPRHTAVRTAVLSFALAFCPSSDAELFLDAAGAALREAALDLLCLATTPPAPALHPGVVDDLLELATSLALRDCSARVRQAAMALCASLVTGLGGEDAAGLTPLSGSTPQPPPAVKAAHCRAYVVGCVGVVDAHVGVRLASLRLLAAARHAGRETSSLPSFGPAKCSSSPTHAPSTRQHTPCVCPCTRTITRTLTLPVATGGVGLAWLFRLAHAPPTTVLMGCRRRWFVGFALSRRRLHRFAAFICPPVVHKQPGSW